MTSEFFSASAALLGPRVQRHEEGVRCVGACSRVGACECGVTIASPPFLVYGQSQPIFCNFERGLPYWSALTPHSGATTRQTFTHVLHVGDPPQIPICPLPWGWHESAPLHVGLPERASPHIVVCHGHPQSCLVRTRSSVPKGPTGVGHRCFDGERWAGRAAGAGGQQGGGGAVGVRVCVRVCVRMCACR